MRVIIQLFYSMKAGPEAVQQAFAGSSQDSVLRSVFTKEAGHDYLHGQYTEEDKAILDATPGFCQALANLVVLCTEMDTSHCDHEPSCGGVNIYDLHRYMVPDEGS